MLQSMKWAAVLLLVGASGPAHAAVKLDWKFKEGDKFYFENKTQLKQTVEAMGQKIKFDMDTTMVTRYTVKKKTQDAMVLESKIETVKIKSDSDAAREMEKVLDNLKGASFTITLSSTGKIQKFEGYEDLIKKIAKQDENAAKMFKGIMAESTFKQEVEDYFFFGPDKAVDKGDAWKKTQKVSMGPLGNMKAVNQYTYKGKTKEGEQIDMTAKLTYEPPQGNNQAFPLKITKGDFKSTSYKGTLWFDAARGRLVRYQVNTMIKAQLTAEVMNQTIDMSLDQTVQGTIRVLDKAPSDD
jgi:hypothetical protein